MLWLPAKNGKTLPREASLSEWFNFRQVFFTRRKKHMPVASQHRRAGQFANLLLHGKSAGWRAMLEELAKKELPKESLTRMANCFAIAHHREREGKMYSSLAHSFFLHGFACPWQDCDTVLKLRFTRQGANACADWKVCHGADLAVALQHRFAPQTGGARMCEDFRASNTLQ